MEGWGGGVGELSSYQGKQTAGGGLSRPQDSFPVLTFSAVGKILELRKVTADRSST